MCYTIRLERVADYARKRVYPFHHYVLVSPYQDHEMIKEIEKDLQKNDLIFVYRIFPKVLEKVRNRPGNEIVVDKNTVVV